MENRNTILLTIIAIATLLVAIVGATFAYFASNIDTNNTIAVNVNTSNNTATFIATADKDINFTVDAYMMQEHDADNTFANTSNNTIIANNLVASANLNVTLQASEDNYETECSYDIIFKWNDTSKGNFEVGSSSSSTGKGHASTYYIRTDSSDIETFKELTITAELTTGVENSEDENDTTADYITETNIDEFQTKNSDDSTLYLKQGETIGSISTTDKTYANYKFTVKFYNLTKDQSKLAGKNFAGTISVANVKC